MANRFYHGTMAFGKIVDDYINGPTIAVKRIFELTKHPEWEVCCSNHPIGSIGVVLKGTAVAMFSGDVSSVVIDGHRIRSDVHGTRYHEISADEWDTYSSKSHTEAWVTDFSVESIWVTEGFAWENEELIPGLKSLNISIEIVQG